MESIVSYTRMLLIRTDSDTYAQASLWDCFLTAIHQNTKTPKPEDSFIQSH